MSVCVYENIYSYIYVHIVRRPSCGFPLQNLRIFIAKRGLERETERKASVFKNRSIHMF